MNYIIKGPIKIKSGGDQSELAELVVKSGAEIKLPFDATGWESEFTPPGVTVKEPTDIKGIPDVLEPGEKPAPKKTGSDAKSKKTRRPKKVSVSAEEKYHKRLTEIQGIGNKTASDIITAYPVVSQLKAAIKAKRKLPFRDDIERKLKKEF